MSSRFDTQMSERVYGYLTDQILSRELKPGDKIHEQEIAKVFETSRTPVREALRDLAKSGIINIYPNRYSEVAQFDDKQVKDVGLAKTILDRQNIRMAGYYGSRAEYSVLQDHADRCYQAAKDGHTADRIRADSDFHWKLARIGKNSVLRDFMKILLIRVEYLQAARYLTAEDPESQYENHTKIVECLMSGDLDKAQQLVTEPNIRFYGLQDVPPQIYL